MTDSAGQLLTSRDPEPGLGVVVEDATGTRYWHVEGTCGGHYWLPADRPDGDPESWAKIAGNYGPVRLITGAS